MINFLSARRSLVILALINFASTSLMKKVTWNAIFGSNESQFPSGILKGAHGKAQCDHPCLVYIFMYLYIKERYAQCKGQNVYFGARFTPLKSVTDRSFWIKMQTTTIFFFSSRRGSKDIITQRFHLSQASPQFRRSTGTTRLISATSHRVSYGGELNHKVFIMPDIHAAKLWQ